MARAHGLRGEVAVVPVTNRSERFAPGAELWCGTDRLVVAESRPHQGRWLVRFVGVDDRDAAEALRGAVLTAPPLDDDEGALWVHELVGAEVVAVDGARLGRVAHVEANPAHDLLVLDTGPLVPVVFVVDAAPGRVVVDPPDGLLELFANGA